MRRLGEVFMKAALFVLVLTALTTSTAVFAAAPEFCNLRSFEGREKPLSTTGLKRAHGYQLGQTLLIGLAVGASDNRKTQAIAKGKECVWYFNDGNAEATRLFNWKDLPKPTGNQGRMVQVYTEALEWMLNPSSSPFWSCLEGKKTVVLGCDGMKHRGPTMVAGLLSFLGCEAQDSVAIVNRVWGSNGISTSMRKAIAQSAKQYGDENPDLRARALARFTGSPIRLKTQ